MSYPPAELFDLLLLNFNGQGSQVNKLISISFMSICTRWLGEEGITLITFSDFAGCPNQQVTNSMEVVVGHPLLTVI